MLVYFLLIRPLLTERRDGEIRYRSLWPAWLSLEESVYKPLFRWLIRVLMTLCRMVCDLLDLLVLVMRRTLLRDTCDHVRRSPHSSVVRAMSHNSKYSQEETADHVGTVLDAFQRMEGSLLCPADGVSGSVPDPAVRHPPRVRIKKPPQETKAFPAGLLYAHLLS